MTKEAIKTNLNEILDFIKFAGNRIPTEHWSWDSEKYDWIESLNEVIGVLDQEPIDDAISRQTAIDGINRYFHDAYYQRTSIQDCRDCLIEDVIKPLPSVKSEPKTGHWIDRFPAKECKCSICDFLICISNGSYVDMVSQMKYCPNCGAKMVESEDEE